MCLIFMEVIGRNYMLYKLLESSLRSTINFKSRRWLWRGHQKHEDVALRAANDFKQFFRHEGHGCPKFPVFFLIIYNRGVSHMRISRQMIQMIIPGIPHRHLYFFQKDIIAFCY